MTSHHAHHALLQLIAGPPSNGVESGDAIKIAVGVVPPPELLGGGSLTIWIGNGMTEVQSKEFHFDAVTEPFSLDVDFVAPESTYFELGWRQQFDGYESAGKFHIHHPIRLKGAHEGWLDCHFTDQTVAVGGVCTAQVACQPQSIYPDATSQMFIYFKDVNDHHVFHPLFNDVPGAEPPVIRRIFAKHIPQEMVGTVEVGWGQDLQDNMQAVIDNFPNNVQGQLGIIHIVEHDEHDARLADRRAAALAQSGFNFNDDGLKSVKKGMTQVVGEWYKNNGKPDEAETVASLSKLQSEDEKERSDELKERVEKTNDYIAKFVTPVIQAKPGTLTELCDELLSGKTKEEAIEKFDGSLDGFLKEMKESAKEIGIVVGVTLLLEWVEGKPWSEILKDLGEDLLKEGAKKAMLYGARSVLVRGCAGSALQKIAEDGSLEVAERCGAAGLGSMASAGVGILCEVGGDIAGNLGKLFVKDVGGGKGAQAEGQFWGGLVGSVATGAAVGGAIGAGVGAVPGAVIGAVTFAVDESADGVVKLAEAAAGKVEAVGEEVAEAAHKAEDFVVDKLEQGLCGVFGW